MISSLQGFKGYGRLRYRGLGRVEDENKSFSGCCQFRAFFLEGRPVTEVTAMAEKGVCRSTSCTNSRAHGPAFVGAFVSLFPKVCACPQQQQQATTTVTVNAAASVLPSAIFLLPVVSVHPSHPDPSCMHTFGPPFFYFLLTLLFSLLTSHLTKHT